jgi:hypothetical protein
LPAFVDLVRQSVIEHDLSLVERNLGDYNDVPGLMLFTRA